MVQDLFFLNESSVDFSSHYASLCFLLGTLRVVLFVFCAEFVVALQAGVVLGGPHCSVENSVSHLYTIFISAVVLLFPFFAVFSQFLLFYDHFWF